MPTAKKSTTRTKKITVTTAADAMVPAAVPVATQVAEITHEMVAKRAYEIWCGKGCPWGFEAENWREAEAELAAERGFATKGRAGRHGSSARA